MCIRDRHYDDPSKTPCKGQEVAGAPKCVLEGNQHGPLCRLCDTPTETSRGSYFDDDEGRCIVCRKGLKPWPLGALLSHQRSSLHVKRTVRRLVHASASSSFHCLPSLALSRSSRTSTIGHRTSCYRWQSACIGSRGSSIRSGCGLSLIHI